MVNITNFLLQIFYVVFGPTEYVVASTALQFFFSGQTLQMDWMILGWKTLKYSFKPKIYLHSNKIVEWSSAF